MQGSAERERDAHPAIVPAVTEGSTKAVSLKDMDELAEVIAVSLESYGELLNKLGEIELRSGSSLAEASKRMASKEFLNTLVSTLNPAQLGLMFKIVLRMSSLGDLSIDKMTPQQKIETASVLRDAANDMRRLSSEIEAIQASP